MIVKPLRNNVIVTRLIKDTTTAAGIILQTNQEPDQAEVVSIGPEVDEVVVGEKLLINWNKAYKIEKETYRISVDDIVAVFD